MLPCICASSRFFACTSCCTCSNSVSMLCAASASCKAWLAAKLKKSAQSCGFICPRARPLAKSLDCSPNARSHWRRSFRALLRASSNCCFCVSRSSSSCKVTSSASGGRLLKAVVTSTLSIRIPAGPRPAARRESRKNCGRLFTCSSCSPASSSTFSRLITSTRSE